MELSRQDPGWRFSARLILILLVLGGALPFVSQAFHIDDRIYLEIAGNILQKPLFPYDYAPVFEGLVTQDAASHSHLPLISYYVALVRLMTGSDREWIYHVAFLVFPFLAAFAFYDLARRYVHSALAATCLLLFSPAFLVLSHTLMADVPLLAFWIVALSRFLKIASGEAKRADWIVCGGALLAASFISLISVGLILLISAYLFLDRDATGHRRISGRGLLGIACLLALPLLLWMVWYLRAYVHYDRLILINTFLHMSKRAAFSWELLGSKALSFVLNLGGTLLFPVAIWYGLARRASARVFLMVFFWSFVPFYIWVDGWSWKQVLLFALFFASGLLVLWHFACRFRHFVLSCFRDARAPHEVTTSRSHGSSGDKAGANQGLLLLWFLGTFFFCVFVYYSGSVRYLLLAVPPVVLWWVGSVEKRVSDAYFLRNLLWLGVVLTGIYSLSIAYADFRFAAVYRTAAEEIHSQYAEPDRTIWITGEWGFRYYFEKSGARILARTQTGPRLGDIIVKPYVASPWVTLYDGDEHLDLLEQRHVPIDYPLRLLDFFSHAGFYSTGWGILPLSFAEVEKWEWFNVFRVKKEYEGPIPEAERHF